jgi:hypothetical protein
MHLTYQTSELSPAYLKCAQAGCWCLTHPSYSGDKDQEDHGSKPACAKSSQDPISKKNPSQKNRTGRVAQGEGPEFKPQYQKKKKSAQNTLTTVG